MAKKRDRSASVAPLEAVGRPINLKLLVVPAIGGVLLGVLALRGRSDEPGAPQIPPPPPSMSEQLDRFEQARRTGDSQAIAAARRGIVGRGSAAVSAIQNRLVTADSPAAAGRYVELLGSIKTREASEALAQHYLSLAPSRRQERDQVVGALAQAATPAAADSLSRLYHAEAEESSRTTILEALVEAGAPPQRIEALRTEPSVASRAIQRNLAAQERAAQQRGDTTTAEALRAGLEKMKP